MLADGYINKSRYGCLSLPPLYILPSNIPYFIIPRVKLQLEINFNLYTFLKAKLNAKTKKQKYWLNPESSQFSGGVDAFLCSIN